MEQGTRIVQGPHYQAGGILQIFVLLCSILCSSLSLAFQKSPTFVSRHSNSVGNSKLWLLSGNPPNDSIMWTPLQQKLYESGVLREEMLLCVDKDWNNPCTIMTSDNHNSNNSTFVEEKDDSIEIVDIKTLVWEVSYDKNNDNHDAFEDYYYFATASRIDDKVHIPSLRDLVGQHCDWGVPLPPSSSTATANLQLRLAPKDVAETLTGFQSGCIPPIGHRTPLKLFVESSILVSSSSSSSSSPETIKVSMGGGILGKSLVIPLGVLLRVAGASIEGMVVGSFLQKNVRASELHPTRTLITSSDDENDSTPIQLRQRRKMERNDRRPEPKDRLQEYRRLTRIVDKAKLLKSTARKQGRVEEMKTLVEEAIKTGEFPMLFDVAPQEGMDKNALHVCAWRGDFEIVKLLVTTAKQLYPTLDVLNIITKGTGNYGKTPLFFALTQCREDVVRYLVQEGANLLIVNNKGQTPCSIAVSHLKEDAAQYLFEMETQQLMAGHRFMDYRASHSDGKLYGDLDPRFPIDSANFGDGDLEEQMSNYNESVRAAPPESIYGGFPSQFEPRSLRPTVRWWVRETRSLAAANDAGCSDGVITFTQPRPKSPAKTKIPPKRRSRSPRREEQHLLSISIDELPRLKIEDILEESSSLPLWRRLTVVNDPNSLSSLEDEIEYCLKVSKDSVQESDKSYDNVIIESTWGIDCEWKPGTAFGMENPVSTLQLSTRRQTFLVDLQTISQAPMSLQNQLDNILTKLFWSRHLHLIGYGVLHDIGKLAASFPEMTCFLRYRSVIDLQSVVSTVYTKAAREIMSSLQKITAQLLRKRLDKTQQCSDWTIRPLSLDQLDYAMLDAAVLPRLLETMINNNPLVEGCSGQFFKIHSHLQTSIRFIKLAPAADSFMYHVPTGSIKTILGDQWARQCWPSKDDSPPLPDLILSVESCDIPKVTKKEKAHLRKVGETTGGKRPKPIELRSLAGNIDNLPIPGITLGYTKESCVFRVIGHRLLNSFPDGTYIGFNRRAGVVETTNAWIIFCNFGTRSMAGSDSESYSDFSDGGRHLSFRLNPKPKVGKSSEGSLYRHLTGSHQLGLTDNRKIILFARDGTKSKYLFCGLCECINTTPLESGCLSVLFRLLDFDQLVGIDRVSSDFENLVASRQKSLTVNSHAIVK